MLDTQKPHNLGLSKSLTGNLNNHSIHLKLSNVWTTVSTEVGMRGIWAPDSFFHENKIRVKKALMTVLQKFGGFLENSLVRSSLCG